MISDVKSAVNHIEGPLYIPWQVIHLAAFNILCVCIFQQFTDGVNLFEFMLLVDWTS